MTVFHPAMSPAFYDLSDRAKLRVRGADAARYLQGQLTNDVRRAAAGATIYGCVLTAKGRLVADVFLRADGPDGFLLDADPALRETLPPRLERYVIADDVTVEDVTDELALVHLVGGVGPVNLALPSELRPTAAERFGTPGQDVVVAVGQPFADLMAVLHGAGVREATAEEAEARRIAAGIPRWGAELDADTLPPEAGLEARAISYTKGCYVGQETISRLKSLGHVNRHLRRLRPVGAPSVSLAPGQRLLAPGDGDREVGQVTSAAGGCALGYVRRGFESPGTRLRLGGVAREEVEVVEPTLEAPPVAATA